MHYKDAIVEVNGIFRDLSSLIHDQRFLVGPHPLKISKVKKKKVLVVP
jgi:hypothetical protein